MKFYEVMFPNEVVFMVKCELGLHEFIQVLGDSKGFRSWTDEIYNPKLYMTVQPVKSIQEWEKMIVRDLKEVLV